MSSSRSIIENEIPCKKCGSPIHVPDGMTDLTCESCDTSYKFRPETRYCSYLGVIGDNKKKILYRIDGDLIIGRDDRDVLVFKDSIRQSIKTSFPVKTIFVSRTHSKIKSRREYQIVEIDSEQHIVNKQVCTLSDVNSRNGTALNGAHLKHGDEKSLEHGSIITLAPDNRKYVEIEYIERRED